MTTNQPQTETEHERLVDHIKCEMGDGGPIHLSETADSITFRTLSHKEQTITLLAEGVGYQPESIKQKTINGCEMSDITFT